MSLVEKRSPLWLSCENSQICAGHSVTRLSAISFLTQKFWLWLQSLSSRMSFDNTRALLVGAGGIGCELLKTLCLHNLREIFIVEIPFFHKADHTGRPGYHRPVQLEQTISLPLKPYKEIKSFGILSSFLLALIQVAKEVAQKFNPNVKLEARHANIKDPEFNLAFFKGFDIVFNALDNLGIVLFKGFIDDRCSKTCE